MPNALAAETSPYLLQHQHNPVDWQPWGDVALAQAQAENRLMVVSIGYSACHWCHVMERECFEDEEVALLMNAHFVSIKIDREERPDIDAVYMDALHALNGNGGWPLNMVCLPDGRPVWGGTYFPKPAWMHYLAQLARLWQDNPERFSTQADQLVGFMHRLDQLPPPPATQPQLTLADATRAIVPLVGRFDDEWGGWQQAPKFPVPAVWRFFLEYTQLTGQRDIEYQVQLTLRRIAQGGIFDHLAGGFARYSVDAQWQVPHFEKMLYDNGQLLSLLSHAHRWQPNALYAETAMGTFKWMATEMRNENRYFAALDADSEGVEGKFYVWTKAEIDEVLGPEAELFCRVYNVTEEGNWEHGQNVLWITEALEYQAEELGIALEDLKARLKACRQLLLTRRDLRTRPGLDDKVLTSWNALAITGFLDFHLATGNARADMLAINGMDFILTQMADPSGGLFRTYKNGVARLPGFADDYAFTIQALIALNQVTFVAKYLAEAERLTEYMLANFSDEAGVMFYFTSRHQPITVTRKRETQDNVIPSSNAQMAHNLLALGTLLDKPAYTARARQMLNQMLPFVEKHLASYAHWGSLLLRVAEPGYEVAVVGPDAASIMRELRPQVFHPFTLWAMAARPEDCTTGPLLENRWAGSKTLIYVCQHGQCHRPVSTVNEALEQLQGA